VTCSNKPHTSRRSHDRSNEGHLEQRAMRKGPGQRRQLGTGAAASVKPPAALGTPSSNSSNTHKEWANTTISPASHDGTHLPMSQNDQNPLE